MLCGWQQLPYPMHTTLRIVVGITDGVMAEVHGGLSQDQTLVAESARQAEGGSGGGQSPAETLA